MEASEVLRRVWGLVPAHRQSGHTASLAMRSLAAGDPRWGRVLQHAADALSSTFPGPAAAGPAFRMKQADVPDSEAFNLFRQAVWDAFQDEGLKGRPAPLAHASLVDWLEDLRLRAPMVCGSWRAQDLRVFLDCFLLGVDSVGGDTSADRRRIAQAVDRLASPARRGTWDVLLDDQSSQGAVSFAVALEEVVATEASAGTLPTTSTKS